MSNQEDSIFNTVKSTLDFFNNQISTIKTSYVTLASAQSISGVKTFTGGLIVRGGDEGIAVNSDNSYLELCGGSENSTGAWLDLYGSENSNEGAFKLAASDGTNTKRLIGLPDGTLTWDGSIYCTTPSDPDEDSTMVATTSWVQDLVQSSGSQIVIDNGRREVWTVSTASASGDAITLPNSMSYVVGSNRLLVVVNGVVLMPTYNYTEVGSSGDTATTITMLMPLAVGDEVMAWTVPVCASGSGLSSIESRLSALENVITDLSTESF